MAKDKDGKMIVRRFQCAKCGQLMLVTGKLALKSQTCPTCGHKMQHIQAV